MAKIYEVDFAAGRLVEISEEKMAERKEALKESYANELMMCARPGGKWYGAEYDGNLDVKEIAKLVRKALKAELPAFKFGVRIDRYSGGCAIRVGLKEVPDKFVMAVYSEEAEAMYGKYRAVAYSPELVEVLEMAREIVERWNFDDSNSMVDYFHVNYYSSVNVAFGSPAYDKEKAERAAIEAAREVS